jgi:hypothetical protein
MHVTDKSAGHGIQKFHDYKKTTAEPALDTSVPLFPLCSSSNLPCLYLVRVVRVCEVTCVPPNRELHVLDSKRNDKPR